MESLEMLLQKCSDFIWGVPMIVLLFGTHIFLTIRLKVPQMHIGKAVRLSVTVDEGSKGDITQFGALATALAATIGTGNIVGVSTAVALGGPGAVAWCWLTGVFGMATKYGEALLSVKYRQKDEDGSFVGGPMYVMEHGMGTKWLAVIFAFFAMCATFGAGCTVQANAVSGILKSTFHIPLVISGGLIVALTAFVVLGGVKKIARVCEKLVPFMALFYIVSSIVILIMNREYVLPAFALIGNAFFAPRAAMGGFVGSTIITASRYGIARGLFSNESGLGTAPIAAACAQTKNPVRQALVSMTGTFWDTVVVCAVTGLVIVTSMLHVPELFEGAADGQLVERAFALLGNHGNGVLAVALVTFAFTTILGWCFYGEKAVEYLFGKKGIKYYRAAFLIMLFVGSVVSLGVIWKFADLVNGLMAFPNLICLLALNGILVKETRHYLWENNLEEEMR